MPVRSGGGSHRSGSHTHHRSSSSTSHHSSHSSSRSYNQNRYRYHHSYTRRSGGVSGLIALIAVIAIVVTAIKVLKPDISAFSKPKKLKPKYTVTNSYIDDYNDIIKNDTELQKSLTEFQEETGICPYVVTAYNEAWSDTYSSVDDYAFDYYTSHFKDEQHFLVVYSIPSKNPDDWSWESIKGDETVKILTDSNSDRFTTDLQSYLEDNAVGNALKMAFDNASIYLMN